MFEKLLIANRGEIAVRIIRTCREMGIATVALYEADDRDSLHVRLADEAYRLDAPGGFLNARAVLDMALQKGAQAVHPGYGFLAESQDFIALCEAAGIAFIGPPLRVVQPVTDRVAALNRAREAGFRTVDYSPRTFGPDEVDALPAAAQAIGYPLMVKSVRGGRGPGSRWVRSAGGLERAVRQAQAEAQAVFDDQRVYLEKALPSVHQIGVQILADRHGNVFHLGEREGSLLYVNRKLVEEAPAPSLSPAQREQLWDDALRLARRFGLENACTVEFIVDGQDRAYFTEIKTRIQTEHPLVEMLTRVDLVRQQMLIAAGERLAFGSQADVLPRGWAIQCRITAEDPWHRLMPSPGRLDMVRFPGGPDVRSDTYVYSGAVVPSTYSPLIAKLIVWGDDRPTAVARLKRALSEVVMLGVATNLPVLQEIISRPGFESGQYDTSHLTGGGPGAPPDPQYLSDLAAAVAIYTMRRNQSFRPTVPDRLHSGWHRDARRLPR
ncbi:MAG: ATP-grasp domain-containing protein [Anaerolineae bacterium]|nr:ATP-grasp domain-containing protein [Anaerolineae bacterium]